jgi:hypothetical protein
MVSSVKAITNERRLEILHSLGSSVCAACNESKQPRRSHCRRCYYALPAQMRHALYQGFGHGYEEAFEKSLAFLSARPGSEN